MQSTAFTAVQDATGAWSGNVNGLVLTGDAWPAKQVLDSCVERLSYDVLLGPTSSDVIEPTLCGGCPSCASIKCVEPPAFEPTPSSLDGAAVVIGVMLAIGFKVQPPKKEGLSL